MPSTLDMDRLHNVAALKAGVPIPEISQYPGHQSDDYLSRLREIRPNAPAEGRRARLRETSKKKPGMPGSSNP
jgi:hypothetical protein